MIPFPLFFLRPLSQEQSSSSDDPADAWFNAAGILLSLKHAAAERSARMGNPMDAYVVQWAPSGNDPSIAQLQVWKVCLICKSTSVFVIKFALLLRFSTCFEIALSTNYKKDNKVTLTE